MKALELGYTVATLMADACSVKTLVAEVGEGVEPNSSDYFKLHAAYSVAEHMEALLEEVDDGLLDIRVEMEKLASQSNNGNPAAEKK